MVPFLSLICKEFEPPAPYDTNVEFMPTMQFIGPPKTLFNLVLRLPLPILKNRLILRTTRHLQYIIYLQIQIQMIKKRNRAKNSMRVDLK